MESCVVYAPTGEKILEIQHWEIWRGLPTEYQFKETKAVSGKMGLKAEGDGLAIWITPLIAEEYRNNPGVLFPVRGTRKQGKVSFSADTVIYTEITLNDAIRKIAKLNLDIERCETKDEVEA